MLKKGLLLAAALIVAILILAPCALPGTLPVSVIPDGASWIAHVDMEKFVATRLYEYLEKDGRIQIKSRDITRMLKIDLFRDITGLTVFGFGPGHKRAVFAAAGKFDKNRLLTLLDLDEDHREIPYGGSTIYSMDDDEFGAFVNENLIVFGERQGDVEKVLDTAAGKMKNFGSSKLHEAFKNNSAGAFISGVVENLSGLDREIGRSRLVGKASGVFFSARENQDALEVRARVSADTPESAKDMADIAQGFIAMIRLGQGHEGHEGGGDRAASLLQGLQIKLEGNTVGLEINVPSSEYPNLMSRGRHFSRFLD
jgi:hypothetical protein